MDMFGTGYLGFDFFKDLDLDPDRDISYSDEDDNDFNQQNKTHKHLKPHPRIKELDEEEADKQIKESIEEEKRKVKTHKNKRKKMRKKEKKRLEKDNLDNDFPDEEQEESDSSETQEEKTIIDSKNKKFSKSTTDLLDEPQTEPQCNKSSKMTNEEKPVKINVKEDKEPKKSPCIPESVSEEKPKSKPEKLKKTLEKESVEVKQHKRQEKVDKPKCEKKEDTIEIKKEEKQDGIEAVTMDPSVLEYAKKSREIAAFANNLAATGQYEMAVKCFTDAIKYNPKEYKLFGNRSLCFERLEKYENALRDAEVALSMEPNWAKGLFRRAKALCGLRKYYEASLTYLEVLKLESTSKEAAVELKRAQTLHLMEMGFTWAQSTNALKSHLSLEEAIEALFTGEGGPSYKENGACKLDVPEQRAQEDSDDKDGGEWLVQQSSRPRPKQSREIEQRAPRSQSQAKPDLFSVWVGALAPTVTYATLHEVFSRAGRVYSIKMVLEHQSAFVNYTRKEECDRAVQAINGMVVDGCPLLVRYPCRIPSGIGVSKYAMTDPLTPMGLQKTECFFWRTIGCTRDDCTFKHVPDHKGIDKEKYTGK